MPQRYEYDHLIHPATMDSLTQILLAALIQKEPYMPVFVNELFVSSNISSAPGHRFRGFSEVTFTSFRDVIASIDIFDESSHLPVCRFDTIKCISPKASSMVDAKSDCLNVKRLCFNIIWEPDIGLLSRSQADHILTQCCVQDTPSDYIAELEMVAFYFFEQALKNVPEEQIPSLLPHHQKFFVICSISMIMSGRTRSNIRTRIGSDLRSQISVKEWNR